MAEGRGPGLRVNKSTLDGLGVFADERIKKDEIIFEFKGEKVNISSRHSLQIDYDVWLGPSGDVDDYINHSCDPNAYVEFKDGRLYLIALRDIEIGEEITFNYLTTEYDLNDNEVFICNCKSHNCYKVIKGFKHLSLNEKLKLKDYLSPFLKRKLEEELKNSPIESSDS